MLVQDGLPPPPIHLNLGLVLVVVCPLCFRETTRWILVIVDANMPSPNSRHKPQPHFEQRQKGEIGES